LALQADAKELHQVKGELMKGVPKLLSRQQRNPRPTGLRELALLDSSDDK